MLPPGIKGLILLERISGVNAKALRNANSVQVQQENVCFKRVLKLAVKI